jgi:hypothetical protein
MCSLGNLGLIEDQLLSSSEYLKPSKNRSYIVYIKGTIRYTTIELSHEYYLSLYGFFIGLSISILQGSFGYRDDKK